MYRQNKSNGQSSTPCGKPEYLFICQQRSRSNCQLQESPGIQVNKSLDGVTNYQSLTEMNNHNDLRTNDQNTLLSINNEADVASAQLKDHRNKHQKIYKLVNHRPQMPSSEKVTIKKPSVLVIGDPTLRKIRTSSLRKATGNNVSCRIIPSAKIKKYCSICKEPYFAK